MSTVLNVLLFMLQAKQNLQGELTECEKVNAELCSEKHAIQKEMEAALDKAAESQSQCKESLEECEALRQTLEQAVAARHSAHEVLRHHAIFASPLPHNR